MVRFVWMDCPKCKKETSGIRVFDEKDWRMLTVCEGCGGAFEETNKGKMLFRYQFAVRKRK